MRILINYYHPVCADLAKTFVKLGHEVYVSVNTRITDHYGSWDHVLSDLKEKNVPFNVITLSVAIAFLRQRKFDLVGLDGVFDGDDLLMNVCKDNKTSYFCINGYPHNFDEDSKNILSFSWFLPQIQYKQKYPNEGAIKEIDWKNLAENRKSDGKNILVFYPQFWQLRDWTPVSNVGIKRREGIVSSIQRFKECNANSYKVFEQIQEKIGEKIENIEGKSVYEFHAALKKSVYFLHLKHGDCPGIAVMEAMFLGSVVFVMKSFVLASFNQELLIDNFTAKICDSIEEMTERLQHPSSVHENYIIRKQAANHVKQLTSLNRQQKKLEQFLKNCMDNV